MKAAGTAEEGLKLADEADLVLTDLKLPGMDGLELLEKVTQPEYRMTPVMVMSAFGTVENAVEAMKTRRGRFSAQAVFARSPDAWW